MVNRVNMKEQTITKSTIFQGRIFDLEQHQITTASGGESVREFLTHPGAVGIVLKLEDGKFLFVRQYRKAVESESLEIVAGTLEVGEDPAYCAERELAEESGYAVNNLTPLGVLLPSPAILSERIHLFYAEAVGEAKALSLDEDEHVEVEIYTADEVDALIVSGAICDGKTISAWQLYKLKVEANGK